MAMPVESSATDITLPLQATPSFFEKLYVYIWHATPTEYIVVGSVLAILLCIAYTKSRAVYSRTRHVKNSRARLLSMFEEAQTQNQSFEIHVQSKDSNKIIASSILQETAGDGLVFETLTHVSDLLVGAAVDIFFRLREKQSTHYYKCHCKILQVEMLLTKRARVKVSIPNDFAVGQKRNFFRIKPSQEAVRVLALWEHPYDRPLPRCTAEIGNPIFRFTNLEQTKEFDDNLFMPLEDISGSGMGLRIPKPENAEDLQTGMQILCLLVYSESANENKLIKFWCIGKVVNIRETPDQKDSLLLGLEFSNWAIMEAGKSEIRWFHNSATSGVGPITQWVMKMNLEQSKRYF